MKYSFAPSAPVRGSVRDMPARRPPPPPAAGSKGSRPVQWTAGASVGGAVWVAGHGRRALAVH